VLLLAVSFCFAVTWQTDSSPFTFFTSGVKRNDNRMGASRAGLWCMTNASKGAVIFHYRLPSKVTAATLHIYNLSGHAVRKFDLRPGADIVSWDIGQQGICAGVYMAAMRQGAFEKKIQLSIVK
jgi:hypothetical protein